MAVQAYYSSPPNIDPPPRLSEGSRERNETIQKVLLVFSALSSIATVIPPLRLGGCIAMGAIAYLSQLAPNNNEKGAEPPHKLVHAMRVSAIGLGIVGLIGAMPLCMMVSLGFDIGARAIEIGLSIQREDYWETALLVAIVAVNTLALLSLALSSWQLMVAATAVNGAAMGVVALKLFLTDEPKIVYGLSLLTLMGTSIAGSVLTSQIRNPLKFNEVAIGGPTLPF